MPEIIYQAATFLVIASSVLVMAACALAPLLGDDVEAGVKVSRGSAGAEFNLATVPAANDEIPANDPRCEAAAA